MVFLAELARVLHSVCTKSDRGENHCIATSQINMSVNCKIWVVCFPYPMPDDFSKSK